MKKILLLCLVAAVCTACSPMRYASTRTMDSWEGCTLTEILSAMGDPDRIAEDGRGGSIVIYESSPDLEDPHYDILDPEAAAAKSGTVRFYLDAEGSCYHVEGNRALPAPPSRVVSAGSMDWDFFWFPLTLLILLIL